MSLTLPLSDASRLAGTGKAHAKAILVGEHAVVYGAPALAIPLPGLSVTATLTQASTPTIVSSLYQGPLENAPTNLAPLLAAIEAVTTRLGLPALNTSIESRIPDARGLGSSAALAAAVVSAASDFAGVVLDADEQHELIQQAERAAHGTPSGIDARAVVADTAIRFSKTGPTSAVVAAQPIAFVVADSGVRRSSTDAVSRVRALRETQRRTVDQIIDEISVLAELAVPALAAGQADKIGESLRHTHELLGRLEVSTPRLDALVEAAHRGGSPGAKLTGGGCGGCIVAVAPHPDATESLVESLRVAGAEHVWTTVLGSPRYAAPHTLGSSS
jgi:mevalonate kinase